jgi:tRNA (mo5U34)-methyltransferase
VTIDELVASVPDQADRLREARAAVDADFPWYPYDTLPNILHISDMLAADRLDLDELVQGMAVADIGAADGDLAFVLEAVAGWQVDIIDTAPTNMNGLRGARALARQLDSRVEIHDVDLDAQFALPRERYGLVFLLGILYHLQNPYFTLRALASRSAHCFLSTKVARFAGADRTPIAQLPVAYLVAPDETNNDPTNYWIFSPSGLERVVARAGWEILARLNVGDTADSDPSSPEHDERMLLLLRSAVL